MEDKSDNIEQPMKVGKMIMRPIPIEGKSSISGDIPDEDAQGIYAYKFPDGKWYVGKSENVRTRHTSHGHEIRHGEWKQPTTLLFAPVKGNKAVLDKAETDAINWFDRHDFELNNIMKTNRPLGDSIIEIDLGNEWGTPIPWDRAQLPISKSSFTVKPDQQKKSKFIQLSELECYDKLLAMLRRYVRATIPAPADTAGNCG